MNMLLLRGIVLAAVLGILTAGYFGWRVEQRGIGAAAQKIADQRDVDAIKAQAAQKLQTASKEREIVEEALRVAVRNREDADAANQKTVVALGRKLAAMGVLRDPYAQASGCGGGGGSPATAVASGAGNSARDGAEATGLLSEQLTAFLQQQADEADIVNLAYISCRADLLSLKGD